MPSITKSRQWMLDTLDDSDLVVQDIIIDHSRWSVIHRLTFKYEGKLYQTTYSRGATEYQDESPWEYEDEIISYEVQEALIPGYRKVPEPMRRI